MQIYFSHIDGSKNQYFSNICKAIESLGFQVTNDKKKALRDKNTPIFHLNYYEEINESNSVKAIIVVIKKIFGLILIKLFGKKIVWTLHNKVPHNRKNLQLVKFLMKVLTNFVDAVVVHAELESKNILNEIWDSKKFSKKIFTVPFPNYCQNYNPANPELVKNLKTSFKTNENTKIYLFTGLIKPYKNVEILIRSFQNANLHNSKLIIAGEVVDLVYKNQIAELTANNSQVIFIPKFLSDEELTLYLSAADVLVLPYSLQSALNSSGVFLAMSFGKTFLSPNIGTVKDLQNKDFFYSYSYKNNEEHLAKLTEQFQIINQAEKEELGQKGLKALEYVQNFHSLNKTAQALSTIYQFVLKGTGKSAERKRPFSF